MSKGRPQRRDLAGPSKKQIMERLHAEGVDTVEKLVEKLLSYRASNAPRRPHGDAFPGSLLANRETRPKGLKGITHQPPKVPLYVDGVGVDPRDISRFDGRPLEFVVAKQRGGDAALFASTSTPISDHMKAAHTAAWLNALGPRGIGHVRGQSNAIRDLGPVWDPWDPPLTGWDPSSVQMFQDIDYEGNWTWCAGGEPIPDLRQVSRDCTLWWCEGDWNDQISSMSGTGVWVAYYSDIWYGGNVLWQQPGQPFSDLRLFGWNDQISSVWNTGNYFRA
jgi:hypothetical protein